MSLEYNDGDGAQALDQQQDYDRWQFSVVDGCEVSPGTNDMTVQVAAGTIIYDGSTVDVSAQDNVDLDPADSTYSRKDTIYLDSTGTLQVERGDAEPAKPSTNTRFQTRRPAPPELESTDAVVVAEVWVQDGTSDIGSADVRDRRQFAAMAVDNFRVREVNDALRIKPEDDLAAKINDAASGKTIVVELGDHDMTDTVNAKDDQTFIIRGDITARAGSSSNVKDGFMIKGTSSDLIENVRVIYQGGSLTNHSTDTTRPLMEASNAKNCWLVHADHRHAGRSLTFWGRNAVGRNSEELWVLGGRFINSGQNNPALDWSGNTGGGIIGATSRDCGKEGYNFIHGVGSVMVACHARNFNTSGTGGDGIAMTDCKNCTVVGNTVDGEGQAVDGGIAITGDCANNTIAGNTIFDFTNDPSASKARGIGIRARGSNMNYIHGNLVRNVARGIKTPGASDSETFIRNNVVYGTEEWGIQTEGQRGQVVGNILQNIDQDGIRVIDGNQVVVAFNWLNSVNLDAAGHDGIHFIDSGATKGGSVCAFNMIVGNAGNFPDYGIHDESDDVAWVVGNFSTPRARSAAFNLTGSVYKGVMNNVPEAPVDVTSQLSTASWLVGFHDGSSNGPSGYAFHDGSEWVSMVDGEAIAKIESDFGTDTQDGDGTMTTFTIAHGLSSAPTWANVQAGSEDASTDFWISDLTASDIEITYAAAPPSGTSNLDWYWEAE